ncbi:hypothetical protein T01_8509 [Trichinella spiralis]|uniref:MULE transposase domain-containing protein n=1 Tax=Trichinella spiralis TaxID=6334 RepID=A0A0V1BV95_TRISP|nr:hypothetical protein T01_8509 [Trichinella spiralis]
MYSVCPSLLRDKEGSGGAVWTTLDVTTVIKRNDYIESCAVDEQLAYNMEKRAVLTKRSAEETKPIPNIYDEEASAASAELSTSGYFLLFKRVKPRCTGTGQSDSQACPIIVGTCKSRVHRGTYWSLLRVTTLDCWQPVEPGAWMVHSRLYLSGINSYLPSMPLWRASKCQQSIVYVQVKILERTDKAAVLKVDLNPDTIICDFETALIPAIQGYFPNTRVQGCCFYFCQAIHRKVGELGLKTRYRTEEGTRRKIRMLLATAFLPVPEIDTSVRLLETGTTGTLAALFQYFRQEWMTDERLPLWMYIITNNHLEGWHNRLNRKAAKSHNGLYELLQILIAEQGVMDTLIQQVLSRNATVGDLRRVNKVYAEKQLRVAQYTCEYTSGSRTLEQFLEAFLAFSLFPLC